MAETLKRWDEQTQQWVPVTNITRLEVVGGGGDSEFAFFPFSLSFFLWEGLISTTILKPEEA